MPIYEYQCRACGHGFETIQKISDDPLVDCPTCEQPELKKLVSRVAFRLKGSGWYETDFKTNGKRNIVDDDKSESKNEGTETDGKARASDEATKSVKSEGKTDTKTPSTETVSNSTDS